MLKVRIELNYHQGNFIIINNLESKYLLLLSQKFNEIYLNNITYQMSHINSQHAKLKRGMKFKAINKR